MRMNKDLMEIILKIYVHKLQFSVITLYGEHGSKNLIKLHFSSKHQHRWEEGGKEHDEM
jgi:hypothetical protein